MLYKNKRLSFKPQAIFIDVDKTLTNLQREITEQTKAAVQNSQHHNLLVVASTGRSYAYLKNYVLPLFDPKALHIVAGGGEIISSTGQINWVKNIPHELVKKICLNVEKTGGNFGFGAGDTYYGTKKVITWGSSHLWQVKTKTTKMLDNWQTPLLNILDLNQEIIDLINQHSADLNIKEMISHTGSKYFDLTAAGVNKGTTAKIWADKLNIDLKKTIAIGDSENDLEILKVVGHGVAMGNAFDEVKEVADQVIKTADENGVAEFLNELIEEL